MTRTDADLDRQQEARSGQVPDGVTSALALLLIAIIGPSTLQLMLAGQPWLAVQLCVVGFVLGTVLRNLFRQ